MVAGSILLVGTLLFSSGCGYKGDPLPPDQVVPEAIRDLRATLGDEGAKLTWSYPLETVSGDDIEEIESFELYRAEIPLADYCDSCPIPFADPIELPGGVTATKTRRVGEFTSGMLRSGHKYFFKMRARTSWWASSNDSNIVTFVYHVPASAPQSVEAKPSGSSINLSWQPVTTLTNGDKATLQLYYQVLRSSDGKSYTPIGRKQKKNTFADKGLKMGTSYFYKVQSSMQYEDEMVAGSTSDAVKVALADTKPPPKVTGVTVVASAKDIRIFWDSVKAGDLAGYRIYRKAEGSAKAELIGKVGPTQTIFTDSKAPQGVKLYYQVSAFDNAKPANEGERSEEATTRH